MNKKAFKKLLLFLSWCKIFQVSFKLPLFNTNLAAIFCQDFHYVCCFEVNILNKTKAENGEVF